MKTIVLTALVVMIAGPALAQCYDPTWPKRQ